MSRKIIYILGTNCSGKSTFLQQLKKRMRLEHINIIEFHKKNSNIRLWNLRALLRLFRFPASLAVFVVIGLTDVGRNSISLAFRYARFFYFDSELLESAKNQDNFMAIDEGVIKKLYEAVPFPSAEEAEAVERKWIRLNRRIVSLAANCFDFGGAVFLYMDPNDSDYMDMVKRRGFYAEVMPDENILRRYRIQRKLYCMFLEHVQKKSGVIWKVPPKETNVLLPEILRSMHTMH